MRLTKGILYTAAGIALIMLRSNGFQTWPGAFYLIVHVALIALGVKYLFQVIRRGG